MALWGKNKGKGDGKPAASEEQAGGAGKIDDGTPIFEGDDTPKASTPDDDEELDLAAIEAELEARAAETDPSHDSTAETPAITDSTPDINDREAMQGRRAKLETLMRDDLERAIVVEEDFDGNHDHLIKVPLHSNEIVDPATKKASRQAAANSVSKLLDEIGVSGEDQKKFHLEKQTETQWVVPEAVMNAIVPEDERDIKAYIQELDDTFALSDVVKMGDNYVITGLEGNPSRSLLLQDITDKAQQQALKSQIRIDHVMIISVDDKDVDIVLKPEPKQEVAEEPATETPSTTAETPAAHEEAPTTSDPNAIPLSTDEPMAHVGDKPNGNGGKTVDIGPQGGEDALPLVGDDERIGSMDDIEKNEGPGIRRKPRDGGNGKTVVVLSADAAAAQGVTANIPEPTTSKKPVRKKKLERPHTVNEELDTKLKGKLNSHFKLDIKGDKVEILMPENGEVLDNFTSIFKGKIGELLNEKKIKNENTELVQWEMADKVLLSIGLRTGALKADGVRAPDLIHWVGDQALGGNITFKPPGDDGRSNSNAVNDLAPRLGDEIGLVKSKGDYIIFGVNKGVDAESYQIPQPLEQVLTKKQQKELDEANGPDEREEEIRKRWKEASGKDKKLVKAELDQYLKDKEEQKERKEKTAEEARKIKVSGIRKVTVDKAALLEALNIDEAAINQAMADYQAATTAPASNHADRIAAERDIGRNSAERGA